MATATYRPTEELRDPDPRETAELERLYRAPSVRPRRSPASRAEGLPLRWGQTLALAWIVLFWAAYAVQPPADDPAVSFTWYATALELAFLGLLGATLVGIAARRPWAASASLAGAGVFTLGVVLCPATGHHAVAGWWFAQLAFAVALVGISALAHRRARASG